MEYPKNWELIMENWENDNSDEDSDIIVIRDEDGVTAHRVKGIDWLATIKANRRKIFAALGMAVALLSAAVVLVQLLSGDKE